MVVQGESHAGGSNATGETEAQVVVAVKSSISFEGVLCGSGAETTPRTNPLEPTLLIPLNGTVHRRETVTTFLNEPAATNIIRAAVAS